MTSLRVQAIPTRIFHPGDSLAEFILESIPRDTLRERSILAITSKIVSLAERAIVPKAETSKVELIKREADTYLGEGGYGTSFTIKHGLFIAAAGIDESNSAGHYYILYPSAPFESARDVWSELRKELGISELGIILTDSHTQPLRRGVTGIALSWWGFQPTQSLVGQRDLFGREFKMTHVNAVDALATSAVLMMGEGTEPCPLALIQGAPVQFKEINDLSEIAIPPDQDLYFPLFGRKP